MTRLYNLFIAQAQPQTKIIPNPAESLLAKIPSRGAISEAWIRNGEDLSENYPQLGDTKR
jgi:hypothetical protein